MSLLAAMASHVVRRGRRVPRSGFTQLTSKIGPIGYYKGKGCSNEGRHTSKGKYVIQEWKVMATGGKYGPPPSPSSSGMGGGLKSYVGWR